MFNNKLTSREGRDGATALLRDDSVALLRDDAAALLRDDSASLLRDDSAALHGMAQLRCFGMDGMGQRVLNE